VDGSDAATVHNCAGWYRAHGEGRLYLFLPEALAEAAPGYDLKRVLYCLDNAGAITERDNDKDGRLTKRQRVKGVGRPRVYAISPDALLAATED
jgi:putative DNA primase/helicase